MKYISDDSSDSEDNISSASFFDLIWRPFNSCFDSSSFSQRLENGIEAIGEGLDSIGDTIYQSFDDYHRTPSDDLRDIARSLMASNVNNRTTDVKVRLDIRGRVIQMLVKYNDSDHYVEVPFEIDNNPQYIQDIIDNWFKIYDGPDSDEIDLFTNHVLYLELSRNCKRPRNSEWYMQHAEWIKFSYIDGQMRPCGFKKFKNADISE